MFVQIIRAGVTDEAAVLAALDRWDADLRPGAEGFLGSTAGVTPDGLLVLAARFESAEAASANSDRPEQGEWWAEVEASLTGDVDFLDSEDVEESMGGGSDEAGFVQVLVGRGDRDRAREALQQGEAVLRRERPDILGGYAVWAEDGRFVDLTYFTSEAEARAGESKEMSEEARAAFETFGSVMEVEQYLDLPDPRLA